jgi:DNA-binding beta-propeller fold protein YncE
MISARVFAAASLCAVLFSGAGPADAAEMKLIHVMNIGSEGAADGQFKYVEDFAFSREGNLLVTDASHAFVQAFDKTTGRFLKRFGGKGDGDEQLEKPEGIAVDAAGHIYVADYSTGFVK